MTTTRIELWNCDVAPCTASAPAATEGWFSSLYADGCPIHAEIVAAHESKFAYDTRGRGSRATTTVSLMCRCGWVPPSGWTQGSPELLVSEYVAHVREVTAALGVSGPPDRTSPSTPVQIAVDGAASAVNRTGTKPTEETPTHG